MAFSSGKHNSQFVANPLNPMSYMRLVPRSMRKYIVCYFIFWVTVGIYFVYTGFAVYVFKMAYAAVFGSGVKPIHDILAYFPQTKGDAGLVTWSHATNSKKLLQEALNGSQPVMVIESDILMKGGGTSQQEMLPIMAHPPAINSDLTFAEYIDTIVSNHSGSPIGIKLDFKAIEAVELCLQMVARNVEKLPGPLVVNADILRGPGGPIDREPIDHRRFLRLHLEHTPSALLSIGWTTSGRGGRYGWEHVVPMWELVRRLQHSGHPSLPVTYPVRSSLLPDSLPQLRWLAEVTGAGTSSLTVWTSVASDEAPPDARVLRAFREALGAHRVFIDLPGFSPAESLATSAKPSSPPLGGKKIGIISDFNLQHIIPSLPSLQLEDWTIVSGDNFAIGGGCVAGRLTPIAGYSGSGGHRRRLSLQSKLTAPTPKETAPLRLVGDAHVFNTAAAGSAGVSDILVKISLANGRILVIADPGTGASGTDGGGASVSVVEFAENGKDERQRQQKRPSLGPLTNGRGAAARMLRYSVTHSPTNLTAEVKFFYYASPSDVAAGQKLTFESETVRVALAGLPPPSVGYAPIVSVVGDKAAAPLDSKADSAPIVAVCHLKVL